MAEQGVGKQEQKFEEIELTVNQIQEGKVQQETPVKSNNDFEPFKKILTEHGFLHVNVQGNPRKPAMVTFHDMGLNHKTCFDGYFKFPESEVLLENFCIYHIDAPGQEENADVLSDTFVYPTMEQLADNILTVCEHYNLRRFIGFGVGVGGNILLRFALKHKTKVLGLILVNTVSLAASWGEWGQQKLTGWYLSRSGVTNYVLKHLEWYYFGQQNPEDNIDQLNYLRSCLIKSKPGNLAKYMNSYHSRTAINIAKPGPTLSKSSPIVLSCPVLLMVGSESPIIDQVIDLNAKLDPTQSTFMKLEECGGLLLDEKTGAVSTGVLLFLQGQGYIVHKKVKAFSSITPIAETEERKQAIQQGPSDEVPV